MPKVVLIGAGSYVFTPSILHDLICDHRLGDLDLWLVDPDIEMAEAMAGLAQRMAGSVGVDVTATATGDRSAALPKADYVSTSVVVDGARRWRIDRDVAESHGVVDVLGELGGLGGLSYALRQVALILSICADMERLCPGALLLNVTNPLPRVMTAVHLYTGVTGYGFCNAAQGGLAAFDGLGRLLGRPRESLHAVCAGTNHCSWLLAITDADSGEDLYPQVRAAAEAGGVGAFSLRCLREFRRLPVPGGGHTAEFFPWDPGVMQRGSGAFHGTPQERAQRRSDLAAMAAGEIPWEPILQHRAWERPADLAAALQLGRTIELPMLNVPNGDLLPQLPAEAVVEVPCVVRDGTVVGRKVGPFPEKLGRFLNVTARVNTLAARAAAERSRDLAYACVDLDPAIPNKAGGHAALDELIERHADLLGWS